MYCEIGSDLDEQEREAWFLWEKVALNPTSKPGDLERAYAQADAERSRRRQHAEACGLCLGVSNTPKLD
jgi:hypothetical protein